MIKKILALGMMIGAVNAGEDSNKFMTLSEFHKSGLPTILESVLQSHIKQIKDGTGINSLDFPISNNDIKELKSAIKSPYVGIYSISYTYCGYAENAVENKKIDKNQYAKLADFAWSIMQNKIEMKLREKAS